VRESLSIQVLAGPPTEAATARSVAVVDNRSEIRDFLTSRRAKITPERAGIPAYGVNGRHDVAIVRTEAAETLTTRGVTELVGELSTRSPESRSRWAAHNVRFHRTGRKDIHHPVVGDLHLTFEAMDLLADHGLSVVVYSAEPGSTSEDGLQLLASWAATLDQLEQAEPDRERVERREDA
jgi:hypothetical protein